jgi:hypothetical protein
MQNIRKKYYSDFLAVFRMLCFSIIGGAVASQIMRMSFSPIVFLVTVIVGALFAALISFLLILCWPVYLTPTGIKSYTLWGLYRTFAWSEITKIEHFDMLGLKYLTIADNRGRKIFIPTFLSHHEDFANALTSYAGTEHLLVKSWLGSI